MSLVRLSRRYLLAQDGAAAVEFSLVLMPFLIVLLGTIEVMMAFFIANSIEAAMDLATREVRTGQMQAAGDPEQAFHDVLCDHVIAVDCDDIRFEIVAGDSFGEVGATQPFWEGVGEGNGDVDIGGSSSFIMVRAIYDYHFFTPLIGDLLSAEPGNTMPVRVTAVIRNEPF